MIRESSQILDKAKQNYVEKRSKELAFESNDQIEETNKEIMLTRIREEKRWAVMGLEEEVKDFNLTQEKIKRRENELVLLKDDYVNQSMVLVKQTMSDFLREYSHINTQISMAMKPSIKRIGEELSQSISTLESGRLQQEEEYASLSDDKKLNVEDGDIELSEEEEEGGLNQDLPVGEEDGDATLKKETSTSPNSHSSPSKTSKSEKLTAQKIIDFTEVMLQAQQNGEFKNDDVNVNEVSSLKNQFRYLTRNVKTSVQKNMGFFSNFFKSEVQIEESKFDLLVKKALSGQALLEIEMQEVSRNQDQRTKVNFCS